MKLSPRLLESLRGYTTRKLSADIDAGITVGVVTLPLAMAFDIASGLSPQVGLWTAIIGGFLISPLVVAAFRLAALQVPSLWRCTPSYSSTAHRDYWFARQALAY